MTLLADTSAWHRSDHPSVSRRWFDELTAGRIAITRPVRLEVLYSARSARDYGRIAEELDALVQVSCGVEALGRAEQVQAALAAEHALHHRSVKILDLLIAAAAEGAGMVLWHYDEDYDRIAAITDQPTEWIAPRGTL